MTNSYSSGSSFQEATGGTSRAASGENPSVADWLVCCAWCARRMDANHEPVGEVIPNINQINCSHGICRECYAAMKRQIKESAMQENKPSIGETLMATGLNAVYAAMERPHQKYDDHQYDDVPTFVCDPDCPTCGGTGKVAVANGPDDFDYEQCWRCSGEAEDER